MRKLLLSLLPFAAAASVQAAPITFSDIHDPSDKTLSTSGTNSYSFEHNILDNGFQPATHVITDADLYISVADDGDLDLIVIGMEELRVSLDGSAWSHEVEVDNTDIHFDVTTSYLQTDGKLLVTVKATQGDFIFKKSTLNVIANATQSAPEAVPEPGSMALMGLGVLGMGAFAWRRKQKA